MQSGKTLAYYTKCLGPQASVKSIYEEAMTILDALKKWRHYHQEQADYNAEFEVYDNSEDY